MTHCIWGLLSTRELEFVHVSGYSQKLKGQSLYQLLHYEEAPLAKRDISKFIANNKFGGSITKCRIRDFTGRSNWLIVDVIIYIATKDLLLCFIHQQGTHGGCVVIREEEAMTNIKENLTQRERLLSPSLSTSSSLSSSNSEATELYQFPYQCFHITNNRYNSILLTWPDYYPNDNTQDILDDRFIQTRTSCFHCVQPPPRINSLGQKVQSLKVDYGILTFVLLRIEDSQSVVLPKKNPVKKYQPYYINPPVNSHSSNKQQQYSSSTTTNNHCQSCGTDSSPEWRRGPTGHKTLCNACGLRYSRSVVRREKLARQQRYALFQSQKTPLDYLYHQPPSLHYH